MTNTISFTFKSTSQSTLKLLLMVLFAVFPLSCLLSVIGTIIASTLAKKLGQELPTFTLLYLFILLALGITLSKFRGRLKTVVIKDDTLSWQSGWTKPQTIRQSEILTVKTDRGRLILNDNIKIVLKGLPQKTSIELAMILPLWLPKHALSGELRAYVQNRDQLIINWQGKETFSLNASTNRTKAVLMRRIGLTSITILFVIVLGLLGLPSIENLSLSLMWGGVPLFLLYLLIWETTKYKRFQVDEKGITYQHGKKELFWGWDEIETLAFRSGTQQLLIWQGSRYKSYSYSRVDTKAMSKVTDTIVQQALIRNIPIAQV